MFGRSKIHSGEIPLKALEGLPDDAFELARFWVNSNQSFVGVGMPERWRPELLGSLLLECILTAASAYATQTGMPDEETLKRMWIGFDEERERLINGD